MAITSSINLDKVSGGVNSLNTGLGQLKKSADTIKTVSLNKIKIKRESISRNKLIGNMRDEAVKRRDQESIVEASGIGGAFKRTGSVIGNSTKGFLDRLLDFTSTLLTGWLLYNLPTILTGIENLITRIKSLYGILTGFISNITNTFQNFGTLLSAVYQNIIQFDFMDHSKRVQKAMDDLNVNIDLMNDQFMEGFDLLTTPLGEGPEEKPIPPLNTDYTQPAPTTGTPTPSAGGGGLPGSQSPEMYRIAAALSTEGSGAQSSVDMMQVVVNRKASGKYGSSYTEILSRPSQFEGVEKKGVGGFKKIQTLQEASKWSGQSEATLLRIIRDIQNPSLQSSAAKYVGGAFEFRAAPQYYLKNGLVPGEMGPDGRFYGSGWRGGAGDNQFLKDPIRDRNRINPAGPASFNLPKPIRAQTSSPTPSRGITTTVVDEFRGKPGGSSGIITSERGKRIHPLTGEFKMHHGIDIAPAGRGYYVSFKKSGKVDYVGFRGAYGNMVDIITPDGTCYRFAHLAKMMVRNGDPYNGQTIGEIGGTGGVSGIHLHYEVRPKGPYGDSINPRPYLGLLSIGKKTTGSPGQQTQISTPTPKLPPVQVSPSPTPSAQVSSRLPQAQVSSTTAPGQSTPPITQNRRGPQIMFVNPAQPSEPQHVSSGGGGGTTIQSMPTEYSLNSMIKNQILLELAYT
jgi:murein DD-endopeptidase MepM/ murein hydrolase activator NlpD